jgi:serine protease AprX
MHDKHKPLQVLIILVFALSLMSPVTLPGAVASAKAQPPLAEIAAQAPDRLVTVIVQKADKSSQAEALVLRLGGKVTKDLHIINAFTAELSAGAAEKLAASSTVRWVSLDAPVHTNGGPINTANLQEGFIRTVGADRLWNEGPAFLQGQGVTVAVVDSGDCVNCIDLADQVNRPRTLAGVSVLNGPGNSNPIDYYGHGSLVEGIVGSTGVGSTGKYMGVAPGVNFVSVKVANNLGEAQCSDVVNGLQWVFDHKDQYNIRVVNLSLNSDTPESYMTNPIDAAVEILWFSGIVVVVSAGNNGTSTLFPPANDPFVITVGATDDRGTLSLTDDVVASFSAYGITESGFVKPDLVAPGTNLISILRKTKTKIWKDHQKNYTGEFASNEYYMRVSGTSFSAPVVSGAVALLLQDEPSLTPDQVKYRLMATANKDWPGYNVTTAGAGYLDIYAAVYGTTTENANTGINPSQLLWTGSQPVVWNSVSWNSVSWNSVSWNSVSWNSVSWNSVSWNSDYWEQ